MGSELRAPRWRRYRRRLGFFAMTVLLTGCAPSCIDLLTGTADTVAVLKGRDLLIEQSWLVRNDTVVWKKSSDSRPSYALLEAPTLIRVEAEGTGLIVITPDNVPAAERATDQGGSVSQEGSGSPISYSPPSAEFLGEDSFTYQACEYESGPGWTCAPATATVSVWDPALDAHGDQVDATAGLPLKIDADELVENDEFDLSGSIESIDTDGAEAIVSLPSTTSDDGADVTLAGSVITYDTPGKLGSDSFDYMLCVLDICDTATVDVEVLAAETDTGMIAVDDGGDGEFVTSWSDVLAIDLAHLIENDSYVDDDPATPTSLDAVSVEFSVTTAETEHGAIVHEATATGGARRVLYSPPSLFTGTDEFEYEVCFEGECDTATVEVTVVEPDDDDLLDGLGDLGGGGGGGDGDDDADNDGFDDDVDNCPDDFNPDQTDDDGDEIGAVCDPDDGDGGGFGSDADIIVTPGIFGPPDYAFQPNSLTVDAGTVSFNITNGTAAAHTLTIDDTTVDIAIGAGPGSTVSEDHTLDPGLYDFYCTIHDGTPDAMEGTIEVVDSGG